MGIKGTRKTCVYSQPELQNGENSNSAPYREQYRNGQSQFELTSLPVDRGISAAMM